MNEKAMPLMNQKHIRVILCGKCSCLSGSCLKKLAIHLNV